jgi:hypothetical protein
VNRRHAGGEQAEGGEVRMTDDDCPGEKGRKEKIESASGKSSGDLPAIPLLPWWP